MAQPQPSQQLARARFVPAAHGAAAPGSGDSKPKALKINGSLRVALVHSTSRAPAAPFASLTAGRQLSTAAFNPLFSLGSLSGSGSSSAYGSSSDSGSGDAAGSSGYETGSDSGDSSDLHLDKINCQICRQPLSKRPGGKRFWQRRKQQREPNMFLICDCCQRCFHEDCCRTKSISTRQQKNGSWFHSSDCQECHKHLKQQAAAGPVALPGGRTWQLIDCEPRSSKDVGGVRALQQLKADLGGVLEVLLPSYGPGAAQQLVDTNNGYALLLRQGQLPVTAGLLDVHGKDLAVLDLVATAMEEQGKGHCSALVGALEGWLGPRLGVAQLLAVCPNDEPETVQLWQRRYGFKRLGNKQLSQLQASVPPLSHYLDSVLLAKNLPKQQQQQPAEKQQQQPAEKQQQHAAEAAAGKKAAAAANKRRAATSAVVTEAVVAAAATGAAAAAGTSEQEGP